VAQREWVGAQHRVVGVRGQHDDRDEADGAERAEVGGDEGEGAPQRSGGGEGKTRHVVLPREEDAGAGIKDGDAGD
jgi:hypothetical protein